MPDGVSFILFVHWALRSALGYGRLNVSRRCFLYNPLEILGYKIINL